MAFADYFGKNVQAASSLLEGLDEEAFRASLGNVLLGIAFDGSAANTNEGRSTLDLLVRLCARFYPRLSLITLDNGAKKQQQLLEELARSINPAIELCSNHDVTHSVVVGSSQYRSKAKLPVFYVGSDKWLAKLSDSSPVGSGDSKNPFAAGAASCIGMANVFRSVFGRELGPDRLDKNVVFSALDFQVKAKQSRSPALSGIVIKELYLVGAGAVGNGFLWALARADAKGDLVVIDGEAVELSNLQRYVMALPGAVGKQKAELAREWLADTEIKLSAQSCTWEQYMAAKGDWRLENVAVAVDSADARIRIQSSLPKAIFNSWTQSGECGVSRHGFDGEEACLACLYWPKRPAPNLDEIVLRSLKLPNDRPHLMEVRARLDTAQPTEREFLQRIASAAAVPLERLLAYEGKPLRDFYTQAICGGAVLEFASGNSTATADVPMAFQSALAGVLLAADVVAETMGLRPKLPTITQIDLLRPFPMLATTNRKKDPDLRCICRDQDFLDQYRSKYPPSARASSRRARKLQLA